LANNFSNKRRLSSRKRLGQFAKKYTRVKATKKHDEEIAVIEAESIKEAKKADVSFDEWVKGQGEKLYHGGENLKEVGNMRSKWGAFYMTENPTYAKSYGGKNSTLNEMVLSKNAKIADLRKPSGDLIKQIEDIISPKETGKTITIIKPDGTKLTIPEKKRGLSNPVHSSKDIIQGIKDGKAYQK